MRLFNQNSIGFYALIIQLSSFILLFAGYRGFHYFTGIYISIIFFICLHAVFSALISFLFSFEWWWGVIHFLFPFAIYSSLKINLSPNVYLIALIVFSLVYWSIYKTRVPYYPSKASLIPHLLKYFPENKNCKFIDIGSGLGGLLMRLEKNKPTSTFFGVEIAPIPWLISYIRGLFRHSQVKFKFGNLENTDLSEFDIVFCYLSPAAMPKIWEKVQREMKKGAILFSYEFIIPDVKPDISIKISDDNSFLYGWCR